MVRIDGGDILDNRKIHYNNIVVDAHNDTMLRIIDKETWLPIIDIGNNTDNHIDIAKLIEGGLDVAFFASYTSDYYGNTAKNLSKNLALINALYFTAENNPDSFQITSDLDDIYRAVKNNKIAALPTIEGAYAIEEANYKELLKQYYDLGIRVIGPTWNYSNAIGEGCDRVYGDDKRTPSSGGLTKLGEKVIEELNKLGILIDVSHLAEKTFWNLINISKSPIIASHSAVYNIRKHQRNLKDDQLKAIKENGGVVSLVLFPGFLSEKKEVYVKDFVDHIDYIVNLIGADHVGIGSDFDGAHMPLDLKDASQMYKITDELILRAYKEDQIEKILGKNILRVLGLAQKNGTYKPDNLKAKIKARDYGFMISIQEDKLDLANSKVIIDGIKRTNIEIDKSSNNIYIKEQVDEKFHVITIEINSSRHTEISIVDNSSS